MTPLISLVSGTYNRLPLLQAMVQSFRDNLASTTIPYEVVLVDGGSTDGTIEWAKAQTDVVLIEDGALLGAISAFTRGAQAASGKYVLLSNDDVTFFDGSVIPAIVHLENKMTCGAVAFRDNRPMSGFSREDYKTNAIGGLMDGKRVNLIYAQVGLFRKWLGDRLNWWMGEHNEMEGAATYGGDNTLSAQIWRYGYSVDEVPPCMVEDHIANDELRQVNYNKGLQNDDSVYFTRQYDWSQGGIIVPSQPQIPQQDKRAARILYMPIYEPGWAIQKHPVHGKHGLRDALARAKNKYGQHHIVQEFDYLADDPKRLRQHLIEIAEAFKPDLILTQLQAHLPVTADMLADLKQRTGATIINWNGDQAVGGLFSAELLPLLYQIDLQLITNLDVVPDYETHRIKWAYWQIGYEDVGDDYEAKAADYFAELGRPNPFSDGLQWPVVYLASLRSAERQAIAHVVEEFGGRVFTPGDEFATLYNFSTSKAVYNRAKIIISDNGFTSRGFVSNRLFQALAAGGGVVLQQHVDGLDELTGLQKNLHYFEWTNLDDLRAMLQNIQDADDVQKSAIDFVAVNGTAFVREHFSFDAQVAKLMALLKQKLGESDELANAIPFKYVGANTSPFGLGNAWPSRTRYEHTPGKLLYVNRLDVEELQRNYPGQFERAVE